MDIARIVMTFYKDTLPKSKDLYIKLNDDIYNLFISRAWFWTLESLKNQGQ